MRRTEDGTALFPVSEIFDSIEGEGKRTGYMAAFVRFAGCNLRCTYCDTAYALDEGDAERWMTEEEILSAVAAFPWKRVTLTGGEPLLQDILPLCEALSDKGYAVNIETNGAVPLFDNRPAGVFYTLDYKCPDSGMEETMRPDNYPLLTEKDAVKFVVGSRRDLEAMRKVMETVISALTEKPEIFVSPVWGKIDPKDIVEYIRQHGLQEARIQLQLHKIIWDPSMRGV